MSQKTYEIHVCLIHECKNQPPAGCHLCDECFKRYVKNDPRLGVLVNVGAVNFTIMSNQAPDEIAREIERRLLSQIADHTTREAMVNDAIGKLAPATAAFAESTKPAA